MYRAGVYLGTVHTDAVSAAARRVRLLVGITLATITTGCAAAPTREAAQDRSAVGTGMCHADATADSLISAAVGKRMSGAVLLVAHNGRLIQQRAFRHAQLNGYNMPQDDHPTY